MNVFTPVNMRTLHDVVVSSGDRGGDAKMGVVQMLARDLRVELRETSRVSFSWHYPRHRVVSPLDIDRSERRYSGSSTAYWPIAPAQVAYTLISNV